MYGPDFILPENVILVTFNYRLGVLGFLNTGKFYKIIRLNLNY
jgi:carboxylesterase type B